MSKPIQLDPEQSALVDGLVSAGRYASTEEAVLEGLKLLHAREARLSDLRDAWHEGITSGDYEPLDVALDDLDARYAAPADAGI